MSDPIRTQIDSLSGALQARHEALMDLLAGIANDIIAPPDYTAAFTSLGTKLDAVVTALTTTNTRLDELNNQVGTFYLAQDGWNSTFASQLVKLTTMDDNIQQIQQTIGLHTGGAEFTIASLTRAQLMALNSIYTRLQGIDAPWPANVLAALECICEATSAQVPIDPLDPATQPTGCIGHYQSDGQFIFPLGVIGVGGNVNIATWSVAPDGLSFGSLLGLAVDHSELVFPSTDIWYVFVDSDEDQYADNPLEFVRYPTRQWRQISAGSHAFSVSERGSIVVHLCKVDLYSIPEGECVTVDANTEYGGFQAWVMPSQYDDTYTITTSDNYYVLDDFGDTASGPWLANNPRTFGDNRSGGGYMLRFGFSTSDPTVTITICNPSPA